MNTVEKILREHVTDKENETEHSYGPVYEEIFKRFDREAKLNILELGIERGGSLYAWREIFPNATITGVDIEDKREDRFRLNPSLKFICADLKDAVKGFTEKFDIIIDDSDHSPETMVWIAQNYFPLVKKTGVLIFEDVQIPDDYINQIEAVMTNEMNMDTYDRRGVKGRPDDFIIALTHDQDN